MSLWYYSTLNGNLGMLLEHWKLLDMFNRREPDSFIEIYQVKLENILRVLIEFFFNDFSLKTKI